MPNERDRQASPRRKFLVATVLTVLIGLISRHVTWVPAWIGDLLWATTVYFVISLLLPRTASWRRAAAALTFSFLIEVSQLCHRPWLDHIRDSTLGHLLLGSTFVWTDLIAYTAGVALGIAITTSWCANAVRPTPAAGNGSR